MNSRAHRAIGFGAVGLIIALSALFASTAAGRGPIGTTAAKGPGDVAAASLPQGKINTPDQLFTMTAALARDLSTKPYHSEPPPFPKPFAKLSYDQYRRVRPRPETAIWRTDPNQFSVMPLPRGFIFNDAIELNLVENGVIRPVSDVSPFVDFQDFASTPQTDRAGLGVSGWRALFPFRTEGKIDEAIVFQGGAYFRALAKDLVYGASARALAIGTASRKGEEFPRLSKFWILKPQPASTALTVAALLDTESATGAYLFTIQPGRETVMNVRSVIFPRKEIAEIGVGATSSMFLHSLLDRTHVDDYRPEVHDSDGLSIQMGNGERVWRPLTNPRDLQVSVFHDRQPKGFGLMQRERRFDQYDDLEARYERRPSVWVEPIGDWGAGSVMLVEIPTPNETNDNIVSFWRPDEVWQAGKSYRLDYKLVWSGGPGPDTPVARIVSSHQGANPFDVHARRFIVDFAPAAGLTQATADVWASAGEVRDVHLENLDTGGRRLSFNLDTKNAPLVELRAALMGGGVQQSETWLFRWTPD